MLVVVLVAAAAVVWQW